jgi:hypothetical protein
MEGRAIYTRARGEKGLTVAGVLTLFAAVAFVWFVFLGILGVIQRSHSAKVKERMDRFDSYKPKPKVEVKRNVNGYQVKY